MNRDRALLRHFLRTCVLLCALIGLWLGGCRPAVEALLRRSGASRETAARPAARPNGGGEPASGSLPRIGLAVRDSAGAWCAEFVVDSTAPALARGTRVTIVFAAPAGAPGLAARLADQHPGQCPAAFPQPRWIDYVAHRLDVIDTAAAAAGESPPVALVVASEAPWVRGADSLVRADLDGDGRLEEARRCTADEGEHFTVWSPLAGGGFVRRWHEYFDWGGFTDPTCRPGEDGQGPAVVGASQ